MTDTQKTKNDPETSFAETAREVVRKRPIKWVAVGTAVGAAAGAFGTWLLLK